MKGFGVVAALEAEARAWGPAVRRRDGLSALGDGTLLAVSGMGSASATMAARTLADAGARALMSFGLAGGLDPVLAAGSIVLPGEVICRDGARFPTTAEWREELALAVGKQRTVVAGTLLSSGAPIDTIAAKSAAFRDTGAVAVDMESAGVAQIAAARRLPFIAVRVIVDTAMDALPKAVMTAGCGGQLSIPRLIAGLAAAPRDFPALIRLARRYRAAARSLAAAAAARAA